MAQVTDRTVGANPTGFDMRTELNNIIGALESDNSGSSEPLNPVPYMKWLDTSNATYYYYKERNHDNTAWVTLFRYTVATKIMEVVSNGVVLQDTAIEIHDSSSKTTPVDADEMSLIDSASTFTIKKLTWANLKATLKTYLDTLYQAILVSGTNIKTINSNSILGSGDIVVSAPIASTAEAQAGTNNTNAITPLRLREGLNAGGSAPIYACRAWVNFDGTGTAGYKTGTYVQSGTTVTVTVINHGYAVGSSVKVDITSGTGVDGTYVVTSVIDNNTFTYTAGTSLTTSGAVTLQQNVIRASGNVSSITDNGVGNYTVNFTTAMPDVYFSAAALSAADARYVAYVASSASSLQVSVANATPDRFDASMINIVVFR